MNQNMVMSYGYETYREIKDRTVKRKEHGWSNQLKSASWLPLKPLCNLGQVI